MNVLEIPIRSIVGKKSTFKVHRKHTISAIKKVLADKIKADPANIVFIYNKEELADTQTIESIKYEAGTFIVYYVINHKSERPKKLSELNYPQTFHEFEEKEQKKLEKDVEKTEVKIEIPKTAPKPAVKPSDEEFNQAIDFLQNMGFPRYQCENALKYADYRLSLAADLLCTGQIPDQIQNKAFNEKFKEVINILERRRITPDIIALVISRFNTEDKKAIRNLIEIGIREDKAILAYIALDKNEAAATNLLLNMLE